MHTTDMYTLADSSGKSVVVYTLEPSRRVRRHRPLTARRVARARRYIAAEACPRNYGIRHRSYCTGFWFRCAYCGHIS